MTDIFASKSSHAAATKSKAASAQPGWSIHEPWHSCEGESPTHKKTGVVYIKKLAFAPFHNVSIYDFLETFALQAPAASPPPLPRPFSHPRH